MFENPSMHSYEIKRFSASSGDDERRKRKRRTNSIYLPDDLLTEILLRIPAKTLFQFKLACKFWYDLIRSPSFISTHYTIHKEDKLSLCCHSFRRGAAYTITFLFSDIALDLTVPTPFEHSKIVGCCYGLVCLSLVRYDTKLLLWNPATGDFRMIILNGRCCFIPVDWVYSGLYFDHVANSHKVIRITILPPNREELRVYLDVFTLSNNTCMQKELAAIPCESPNSRTYLSDSTCVGRFMYWVLDFSDGKCLLCFDMVDELFQRIEFPCVDHRRPYSVLAQYRGSLAMFVWTEGAFSSPGESFDMWFLNDDRSWSKKLTLRPSLSDVQRPLGFYVKGGVELVVLSTGSGHFLWNTESGEAAKVHWEDGYIRHFFLYSQSIASVR